MINEIKGLSEGYWREAVVMRRFLHQNPELSFQEEKTSTYIKSELDRISLDDVCRVERNGVLGTIHGRAPGKTILLRADIDALPILEENEHAFVSKTDGVMHACGHDSHTAMLITASKILCNMRQHWEGTIKVLFQPAEEKIPGGASMMIKAGVLKNPTPQAVLGQHVKPELKTGQVGVRSGKFMASSDEVYIKFIGKGGHAAMPDRCIDPVLIAGHFLVAAQQVVSRYANPKMPTVLTFGSIHGNGAANVIPNHVSISGTLRTLDEEWRQEALRKIRKLAIGIAESMGATCEVEIVHGYPFLHNDIALAARVRKGLEDYVSPSQVIDQDIWMAAEDFAYYSHEVPSCFYMLGVQPEQQETVCGLHTPTFDIDENAMNVGAGLMSFLAINELNEINKSIRFNRK